MERVYNCEMEMRGSMELAGQPACLNSWTPSSLRELNLKKIRRTSKTLRLTPELRMHGYSYPHSMHTPTTNKSLKAPFPTSKIYKIRGPRTLCSVFPSILLLCSPGRLQSCGLWLCSANVFSQGSHGKYVQHCEPCPVCHCSTLRHPFILTAHVCALGCTTWLSYNFPGYKNLVLPWFLCFYYLYILKPFIACRLYSKKQNWICLKGCNLTSGLWIYSYHFPFVGARQYWLTLLMEGFCQSKLGVHGHIQWRNALSMNENDAGLQGNQPRHLYQPSINT